MVEPTQTKMLVRKPAGFWLPLEADQPAQGDGQDELEEDFEDLHRISFILF